MHTSKHKRPRVDRRPRDEKLVLACTTGWHNQVQLGLVWDSIPVFPWNGKSTFFDWNELAIPKMYTPSQGTVGNYRPTVQTFSPDAAKNVSVHAALLPFYEYTSTVPGWTVGLAELQQDASGAVHNTADPDRTIMHERAKRLPVNGQYYQVKLTFQGKIHIPEGFNSTATLGGAKPWIRLIAIQFTGPDQTNIGHHQVPLEYFFPHCGTDTIPPTRDPDYAVRRNHEHKGEEYPQPYRVLHDQVWQVEKPDGTKINQIPLKLKLLPHMIRSLLDPDRNDGNGHDCRHPYGPDHEGRVIWQLFHNIAPAFFTAENLQYTESHIPFWEGRWTAEFLDGNY